MIASWIQRTLLSSIGRKLIHGLTGVFLVVFLTVHLVGVGSWSFCHHKVIITGSFMRCYLMAKYPFCVG